MVTGALFIVTAVAILIHFRFKNYRALLIVLENVCLSSRDTFDTKTSSAECLFNIKTVIVILVFVNNQVTAIVTKADLLAIKGQCNNLFVHIILCFELLLIVGGKQCFI